MCRRSLLVHYEACRAKPLRPDVGWVTLEPVELTLYITTYEQGIEEIHGYPRFGSRKCRRLSYDRTYDGSQWQGPCSL